MNYLKNNLNNSSLLPYDVMVLIYEYADSLKDIRKQINTKVYKFRNNIMYRTYTSDTLEPKICGLDFRNHSYYKSFKSYVRNKMAEDCGFTNNKVDYRKFATKPLYKKWLKL